MTTFYFRSTRFIYKISFEHARALPKLQRAALPLTSAAIIVNCIRFFSVFVGLFGVPKTNSRISKRHSVIFSIWRLVVSRLVVRCLSFHFYAFRLINLLISASADTRRHSNAFKVRRICISWARWRKTDPFQNYAAIHANPTSNTMQTQR